MVARALPEASGRICSSTSPREGDDAELLGAFADGNVSVRTAAGVGVVTAEPRGSGAALFTAAALSEFCVAAGGDGFGAGAVSRRAGFSTGSGCTSGCTAAVAADDEESERWPRIFGSAKAATIIRSPAAKGTTELGSSSPVFGGLGVCGGGR